MIKNQHKTLARTLAYIGFHSPSEYGLFWNPDGIMPWKEFYWALQEDPELRFVREATMRELALLGINLPFLLDGNVLRISSGYALPHYPVAGNTPERLHIYVRPKNLVLVQNFGFKASSRPFIPLCSSRELALRMAKRREREAVPIPVEVMTERAADSGIIFRAAGPELFLAEAVPREFLIIPKTREDLSEKLAQKRRNSAPKAPVQPTPGSFTVQPHHLRGTSPAGMDKASQKAQRNKKIGWKKDSRKERGKRDI